MSVERQTRYDGQDVWLPCVDQVQSGDILLTSNVESANQKGMKQSRLIQRATKGRFSHVLICSSPPTFIEAIGTGVSSISLARCFAHNLSNVRVLRYGDANVARLAAKLAQHEIGRDYSVARAVASVFPLNVLDKIDDHGIFCSALVAQVYVAAGGAIFLKTAVDRTTPATIDELGDLEDVTKRAFRKALAPNNIEEMSALDGDRAPSPSARQTVLSAECARALWPEADSLARAYPLMQLSPAPTFYGLLIFVTGAIDSAGKIPMPDRDAFWQRVVSLDKALAAWVQTDRLATLMREIAAIDDRMMTRNVAESFKPQPDIDIIAMRAYLAAGEWQFADRLEGVQSWKRWGPERSAAVSAYLPIDESAAEITQLRNAKLRQILQRCGYVGGYVS